MDKGKRPEPGPFRRRKPALGANQDSPWPFNRAIRAAIVRILVERLPHLGLVTHHDPASRVPFVDQLGQAPQGGHLGNEGAATLFGGLHGMGLQAVAPDPVGIGVIGLNRQDPCRPHFDRFFDDKVGARFLDRGKQQPKIRGELQGTGLGLAHKDAAAFARFDHFGVPFAVLAVKKRQDAASRHPHHRKKVMRLRLGQGNSLPWAQRMIYMKANLGYHKADHMTGMKGMPEGPATETVADAVDGNWVDSLAPPATRPWLRLSRADRPIGTWLLLLPCWWGLALAIVMTGEARLSDVWIAVGCGIGAFLMRGAGCTWNDITDRNIDGQVARTRSRPIPSGQATVKGAMIWLVAQALIAFGILLTFNGAAIALGIAALLPVAIYPFAKRFTWWPQVFLGLAFNWGALLAWTAHTGSLGWPAVVLYVSGIAWTLFYDTIYAHQDAEDDALIGVKSTARLFGDQSPRWLRGFLIMTVLLMGLAVILAARDRSVLSLVVALGGPWAMGWHLAMQLGRFDPEDGSGLIRLFRSNQIAGLLPLPFFAVAAFL